MTTLRHTALLVACVLVSFVPGAVGSRFEPGVWYAELDKPWLTPPGWLFPVAWTALYIAMGVALYLYLTARTRPIPRLPLGLFGLQLVLNGMWSWLFFGLRRPDLALVDVAALWITVLLLTAAFWRRRRSAGALLLPYLVWVSFATYLNAAIWLLNR